ncbi:MAG TPA: RNA polymerase sigma factor [Phycisphaerae bacterium]|nr:RNA polymerase sigma factor [Phycisphaerae bacterium]HRY70259.1 RNA polymerase sigma factor [Phycisphaerae bacterium]HSA27570.1 RNA polymerase sigma factor [Phycisphaerae bacterium]
MGASQDNPSDADLVRTVFEGNRGAYGTLVERHLRSVFAVAARILGNSAEAEDVAQETFLRALERLYLYDLEQPFRNWLFKIATNLALNKLRAHKRERILHLRAAENRRSEGGAVDLDVPSPGQWRYWLEQLDEPQRAAIVLFHFHDMPYTEIAEVLDVPVNTVRTHLHRGRRRLRDLMMHCQVPENGTWDIATPSS